MECTRWVDEGLLYTSGELAGEKGRDFEKHLSACEFCRTELDAYRRDKDRLFALHMLEEAPSAGCDARIRTACSKHPRPTVGVGLFASYVRKGVIPVLFLFLGFVGGVYVAFNVERANHEATVIARQQGAGEEAAPGAVETTAGPEALAQAQALDSATGDSASTRGSAYDSKRLGKMDAQGVMPVDLQNK